MTEESSLPAGRGPPSSRLVGVAAIRRDATVWSGRELPQARRALPPRNGARRVPRREDRASGEASPGMFSGEGIRHGTARRSHPKLDTSLARRQS
ncbi:hypothetical protein SB2_20085 [Methylobacterium radiotolerans]|nr:hypothetical protein SB3_24990 [Methylobacterium radiotolerans]KTS45726.1 hypothetical protein SB2_20085 [Methylobacterium radiotolerans]